MVVAVNVSSGSTAGLYCSRQQSFKVNIVWPQLSKLHLHTIGKETDNGQSRQTTQRTEKTEATAETSSCNARIKIPLLFWRCGMAFGSRSDQGGQPRGSSALIRGDHHFDTGVRILLSLVISASVRCICRRGSSRSRDRTATRSRSSG